MVSEFRPSNRTGPLALSSGGLTSIGTPVMQDIGKFVMSATAKMFVPETTDLERRI